MFDFTNTPITKDTVLQAQWECGKPALTYYGDWGRATASDGRTYELTNINDFNTFVTASTPTQTFSFTDITPVETVKFEFGTKVTYTPVITFRLEAWPNLAEVNGFHEGLTTINNYCFCTYQAANDTSTVLIKGNIILPSTLTGQNHLAAGFMYRADRFVGNLVVNTPLPGIIQTADTTCSTTNANAPFYTQGVNLYGAYRSLVPIALPNRDTSPYRKLTLAPNTIEAFLDGMRAGYAKEFYGPGTGFAYTINEVAYGFTVMSYDTATLPDGSSASGAYCMMSEIWGGAIPWNNSSSITNVLYANSNAHITANGSWKDSYIPSELQDAIVAIHVPYLHMGSQYYVDAKFFLPSNAELYGNEAYSGDAGKAWQYLVDFGGNADNNAKNTRRIRWMGSAEGNYFTRSTYQGTNVYAGTASGVIFGVAPNQSGYGICPAFFIPFGNQKEAS